LLAKNADTSIRQSPPFRSLFYTDIVHTFHLVSPIVYTIIGIISTSLLQIIIILFLERIRAEKIRRKNNHFYLIKCQDK
jgi:hypothetical protein